MRPLSSSTSARDRAGDWHPGGDRLPTGRCHLLERAATASGLVPVVVDVASATSTAAGVYVVCRMYWTRGLIGGAEPDQVEQLERTPRPGRIAHPASDWNAPTLVAEPARRRVLVLVGPT